MTRKQKGRPKPRKPARPKHGPIGPGEGDIYSLTRWEHERPKVHRAMLLWAMQAPRLRSMNAVAKAMGVSSTCARQWNKTRDWPRRLAHHDAEIADQLALDLYRDEYMAEFGKLEIPLVANNVTRPLGALDLEKHLDQEVVGSANDIRARTRKITGKTNVEISQAVAQHVATRKRDQRKDAERHMMLVDGALGVIARAIKAGNIRVSLRDIPALLDARAIQARLVDGAAAVGGAMVKDSARVQHARETGGDVLDAMYRDAEEVMLILGALRSKNEADLAALSEAQQEIEDAQEVVSVG